MPLLSSGTLRCSPSQYSPPGCRSCRVLMAIHCFERITQLQPLVTGLSPMISEAFSCRRAWVRHISIKSIFNGPIKTPQSHNQKSLPYPKPPKYGRYLTIYMITPQLSSGIVPRFLRFRLLRCWTELNKLSQRSVGGCEWRVNFIKMVC
jgi:hypothetical protein